jgi:hypothetical protein
MPILLTPRRRSNQPAFGDALAHQLYNFMAKANAARRMTVLSRRHVDQAA